jgi:hypothetical protein
MQETGHGVIAGFGASSGEPVDLGCDQNHIPDSRDGHFAAKRRVRVVARATAACANDEPSGIDMLPQAVLQLAVPSK